MKVRSGHKAFPAPADQARRSTTSLCLREHDG